MSGDETRSGWAGGCLNCTVRVLAAALSCPLTNSSPLPSSLLPHPAASFSSSFSLPCHFLSSSSLSFLSPLLLSPLAALSGIFPTHLHQGLL